MTADPSNKRDILLIDDEPGIRNVLKITIESDNLTEVAVYKVGKLGRFSSRELNLRPGTYTVVGARDGFKDVRHKIVVKPGQEPFNITVKCKVQI